MNRNWPLQPRNRRGRWYRGGRKRPSPVETTAYPAIVRTLIDPLAFLFEPVVGEETSAAAPETVFSLVEPTAEIAAITRPVLVPTTYQSERVGRGKRVVPT